MNYHISLLTKSERPCITNEAGVFFLRESIYILRDYQGRLVSGIYGKNYLHLNICVPDDLNISKVTSELPDQLAKRLRKDPQMGNKNYYFGEPFAWGECCVTAVPAADSDTREEKC